MSTTEVGDTHAFLSHRQATADGDPRGSEQSEEDGQLGCSFVPDGRFFVEDGWVDDPVEDQQRRDDAEDRNRCVDRMEGLRDTFTRCSTATASVTTVGITRKMGM